MALRTVGVELVAKVQGYKAGINTAMQSTRQFAGELDQLGKKAPGKLHDVELAAGVAGAALLGMAGWAVKASMEFDKRMSEVSAVSGASAESLDQLRRAALAAGKATVFSASEAAKAEAELAKAGISTSDILSGALSGSLDLAAAGSLDLAEASEVAAKAMNIFKLKGEDVEHIADVLAAGANKSATDVHDLGEALKMGGLAAHNAGLSLEDTAGVLSAFADSALNGSDAGTSLKTMLQFLANPTRKAANLMEELGIEVYDANGNLKDIATIAGILQTKLAGLTQQQRQQAFATIFGSDATRAATVLYENGEQGIRDYIAAVDDQGAAQRMASEKTNNLAGDVERLKGSIETLAIESGEGANTGLRFLVQALDHLVSAISEIPAPIQTAIVVLAGVSGAALLTAAGFLKVRSTVRDALDAMREMGPVGTKAAGGLNAVAGAAGKAAMGLGLIMIAFEGVKLLDKLTGFDRTAKLVTRDADRMADALEKLAQTGEATGELDLTFGANLSDLRRQIDSIGDLSKKLQEAKKLQDSLAGAVAQAGGGGDLAGAYAHQLAQLEENLNGVDEGLAKLVDSGHAVAAKQALETMAHDAGLSVDDLRQRFPKYVEAVERAKTANSGLAKGFGDASAQATTMAGTMEDAADAGMNLLDVFNQLNGAELDWREASRNAEAAVDDLRTALDESNGSLSVHDEKGRAAAAAVDTLAKKAAEAAEAKLDETGSIDEANKVYQEYIDQLKKTLLQAGMSKKKVDQLVDSIASMPETKTVKIRLDAEGLIGQINSILSGIGNALHFRRGGLLHMAGGGTVDAGIATSQTVIMGERETGGEAYIPRLGDYSRSMATLAQAAAWYGASVVPGGGGPRTALLNYKITLNAKVIHEALVQYALDTNRAPSGLWPTQIRVTS